MCGAAYDSSAPFPQIKLHSVCSPSVKWVVISQAVKSTSSVLALVAGSLQHLKKRLFLSLFVLQDTDIGCGFYGSEDSLQMDYSHRRN